MASGGGGGAEVVVAPDPTPVEPAAVAARAAASLLRRLHGLRHRHRPRLSAPEAELTATVTVDEDFDSVLLGRGVGGEDAPTPLPIVSELVDVSQVVDPAVHVEEVRGVYCKNRHFNDPRQLFCAVCGINMVQQTPVLVNGLRPPLGVIVLDDGAVFQLDSDYLLGRDPDADERVRSEGCAASRSRTSPTRSPGCTPGSSCAAGTRCSSTTSRPTARS